MGPVDEYEVVPGMATAIRRRMAELKIPDVAELHRMTGVARQILGHLLAGYRKDYRGGTTGPFCEAMQWRYDGVELLLDGKRPVPSTSSLQSGEPGDPRVAELVEGFDLLLEYLKIDPADLVRRRASDG